MGANQSNFFPETTSTDDLRGKILNLEDEMRALEQIDIPIKHYFANGFYAREMTMPAGCALVGKIHTSEHLCILSQGKVEIASEEKKETVEAPYTYVSAPGAKRALYAYSEVVWTTVHLTSETDIDKLESELIAESFQQLSESKLCLG